MDDYGYSICDRYVEISDKAIAAYKKNHKVVGKEYGINTCCADILICLFNASKPHTVRYITDKTNYTKGMISRCLDILEDKEYVSISQDILDRREIRVVLNDAAMPVVMDLIKESKSLSSDMFINFSRKDFEDLDRILSLLYNGIR